MIVAALALFALLMIAPTAQTRTKEKQPMTHANGTNGHTGNSRLPQLPHGRQQPRDFLEIIAAELVRTGRACRVTVTNTVVELAPPVATAAAAPEPVRPSAPGNPEGRLFSEFEVRILLLLCKEPSLTRVEIAGQLGENPDNAIRFILKNLVDRYVLDSGPNGYTLHIPEGKEPAAYRQELAGRLVAEAADTPAPRPAPRKPQKPVGRVHATAEPADAELAERIAAAQRQRANGEEVTGEPSGDYRH